MPAQYFADPSGQQWELSVDNNGQQITTNPVSGKIAVSSIVMSDAGHLWALSIVGPGEEWGEPHLDPVTSGTGQDKLLTNSPNGLLWAISVVNGELKTQPGAFGSDPIPAPPAPRNPRIMLRWSDDGGHTWSQERMIDCGALGEYRKRVIARRLGRSRDRVYELSVSDSYPWRIVDAYLNPRSGQ